MKPRPTVHPGDTRPGTARREFLACTLPHPWGTAALAATEAGVCLTVLRGGRAALRARLAALAGADLLLRDFPPRQRAGGGPLLPGSHLGLPGSHLRPARAWLDDLLNRGLCRPPDFAFAPLAGTPFQRSVWRAIARIPAGGTRTYAALARRLGRPRAARAVGAASAANPLAPIVPCHRLLGPGGALRGYAGGTGMKRALLELECA